MRIKDDYLAQVLAGEASLLFDGAMGSMLQRHGISLDSKLELLNFSDPDLVAGIHAEYVQAGAQVITTNTFCAHSRYLAEDATPQQVYSAAVACAHKAGARYVAADMGPLRDFVEPLGPLTEDQAFNLYAEEARAAAQAGADLIVIETQFDIKEAVLAVCAARECADVPVFATMAFSDGGKTMFGVSPDRAACELAAAGADAIGANCAVGPAEMRPLIAEMCQAAPNVPLIAQANAGVPDFVDGAAVYPLGCDEYAAQAEGFVGDGVKILGGCCGTTPEYIARLGNVLGKRDSQN